MADANDDCFANLTLLVRLADKAEGSAHLKLINAEADGNIEDIEAAKANYLLAKSIKTYALDAKEKADINMDLIRKSFGM